MTSKLKVFEIFISLIIFFNKADCSLLGCYKDDISSRSMSTAAGIYSTKQPVAECVKQCHTLGFRYAGIQQDNCLCGDEMPTSVSASECDTNCTGSDIKCGNVSPERLTVYDVSDISTSPSIDVKTGPLEAFSDVDVTLTTASNGLYTSKLTVSDGSVDVPENSTSHFFRQTGYVLIEGSMTDIYGYTEWSSKSVDVFARVKIIAVECPEYVKILKQFECIATIAGSQQNVSFTVKNNVTQLHQLLETSVYVNGPSSTLQVLTKKASVVGQNLTFLLNRPIAYNGTLTGWEIDVETPGEITLQIYRPACVNNDTHKFCTRSRTCILRSNSCFKQIHKNSLLCNDSNTLYSLQQRVCVNQLTGDAVPESPESTLPGDLQWAFVGEVSKTFATTGIQFVALSENEQIAVRFNDVPVIYTASGKAKVVSSATNYEFHIDHSASGFSGRAASQFSASSTDVTGWDNHETLLNVFVTKSLNVAVYGGVFPGDSSDVENVTVGAVNVFNQATMTTTVKIQKPVTGLKLNGSETVATYTKVTQIATIEFGNRVSFNWSSGDGLSDGQVDTNDLMAKAEHTYFHPGVYQWSYTAENLISSLEVSQSVAVIDLLQYLSFSTMPTTVRGQPTRICVMKNQGSSASFRIDLGDNTIINVNDTDFKPYDMDSVLMFSSKYDNTSMITDVSETLTNVALSTCGKRCLVLAGDNMCLYFEYNKTSGECKLRKNESKCGNSCPGFRRTDDSDLYVLTGDLFKQDLTGSLDESHYSSSSIQSGKDAFKAKLEGSGHWSADPEDKKPHIQIAFEGLSAIVGITVQGDGSSSWVINFTAEYSVHGSQWKDLENGKVLVGNTDASSASTVTLEAPVTCRYLRINPLRYETNVAMSVGVKGAIVMTEYYDFMHTYQGDVDLFSLKVDANNSLSTASAQASATVQTVYSGFQIQSGYVTYGQPSTVSLNASIGTSAVDISASFADHVVNTTVCDSKLPCIISLRPSFHNGYGEFPFVLTVANLAADPLEMTKMISIDHKLVEVNIVPVSSVLASGELSVFVIKLLSNVSRMNITTAFQDKTKDEITVLEYYDINSNIYVNHTFFDDGIFNVLFKFVNLVTYFSRYSLVTIQHEIKNITHDHNSPAPILNERSSGTVTFNVYYTGDKHPTNVSISIDFGDGTSLELVKFDKVHTVFSHIFKKFGTYEVSAFMSNLVSNKTINTTVVVEETIQNFLLIPDREFILEGDSVGLTAVMSWGSNVNLTWTFNDTSGSVFKQTVKDNVTINHNFVKPGKYTVDVVAINTVSHAKSSILIIVEPIISNVYISHDAPQTTGKDVTFKIQSNGTDLLFPTHPDITMKLRDGSTDVVKYAVNPLFHKHAFALFGTYDVEVNVSNSVNFTILQTSVWIDEAIQNLTIDREDTYLKVNEFTELWAQVDTGSRMNLTWDLDGELRNATTYIYARHNKSLILHSYCNPGKYWPSVTAVNAISEQTANSTNAIYVEPTIDDVFITDNSPRSTVDNVEFVVNFTGENLLFPLHPNLHFDYNDGFDKVLEYDQNPLLHSYLFSEFGTYNVSVNITNRVTSKMISTVVWVDERINGTKIFPSSLFLKVHQDVELTTTVSQGSRINLTWTFDDSTNKNTTTLYSRDKNSSIHHSFDLPGVYNTSVFAENSISSQTAYSSNVIYVEPTIDDVFVTHKSPVSTTEMVDFVVNFTGVNLLFPLFPQLHFNYNDGSATETRIYNHSALHHSHLFSEFGTYNVSLNVTNTVTYRMLTTEVWVDEQIADLEVSASPDFVKVGVDTELKTEVSKGSRMDLVWDFGDLSEKSTSIYSSANESRVTHSFVEPGVYRVHVSANNSISSQDTSTSVHVEHPVVGYKLVGESESLLNITHKKASISLTVLLAKNEIEATNAEYTIDYDDSSPVTGPAQLRCNFLSWNDTYRKCMILAEHEYQRAGDYAINMTISNNVSSQSIYFNHVSYEEISDITNVVYFMNSTTNAMVNGKGVNNNYYPLEKGIMFVANQTTGTDLTYTWNYGDGTKFASGNSTSIHRYKTPGEYTVTLKTSNPLDNEEISKPIIIQRSVKPFEITGESIAVKNTNHSFTITFKDDATDACYYIDFADSKMVEGQHRLFGNKEECKNHYKQFSEINYKGVLSGLTFQINVTFVDPGQYEIIAYGSNKVSRDIKSTSFRLGVTNGPCAFPRIDLEEPNKCGKPLCSEFQGREIKQVYKSTAFTVASSVSPYKEECAGREAIIKWSVDELSSDGHIMKISDKLNEAKITLDSQELFFKKRFLNVSKYRFTLNVSMENEIGIWTIASVWMEIIETPLSGSFPGGNFIKRKYGSNFTLNALTNVADPDIEPTSEEAKEGLSVEWSCKRLCETWPVYTDGILTQNGSTAGCTLERQKDKIGCFNREPFIGPGILKDNVEDSWEIKEKSLALISAMMHENETYNFIAKVSKGKRHITFHVTLLLTEGDPPETEIKCVTNCVKNKLNPGNRMSLQSDIMNKIGFLKYIYVWDFYDVPIGGTFDYTNPSKHIRERSTWIKYASTGAVSQDFSIIENLFKEEDFGKSFKIRVKGYRQDYPSLYGEAYYDFEVNTPPNKANVNCTVKPPNGTALNTSFMVECKGFEDDDKPLSYAFAQKLTKDPNVLGKIFDRNSQPKFTQAVQLPSGLDSESNNVYIDVMATDSIGSTSIETVAIPVTIKKVDSAALNKEFTNKLDSIETSGSAQEKSQLVMAMASMINVEVPDETTDSSGSNSGGGTGGTDNSNSGTGSNTDTGTKPKEPDPEKARKELEEKTQLRTKMLNVISSVEVNDPATANTLLSAAMTVTDKPEQISEESQEVAAKIVDQASNQMANMADDPNVGAEALEELAENAVNLLSNVMQASLSAVTAPVSTQEGPSSNGGSTSSSGSGSGSSSSSSAGSSQSSGTTNTASVPKETEEERAKKVAAAKERVKKTQKMLDTITTLSLKKKVIGEAATTMGTGALVLSVRKQYTDKLSNTTISAKSGDDNSTFDLPDAEKMFGSGNDTSSFMSSVAKSEKVNPFPWAQDSSSVSSNINSLSFKDSNDSSVNISGLAAGNEIMLLLQEASPPVNATNGRTALSLDSTLPHNIYVGKRATAFIRIEEPIIVNVTNSNRNENVTGNSTTTASISTSSTVSLTTTQSTIFTTTESVNGSSPTVPQGSQLFFCVFLTTDGTTEPTESAQQLKCTLPNLQAHLDDVDPNVCFLDKATLETSIEGKSVLYKVRSILVPNAELVTRNVTELCVTSEFVVKSNYTTDAFTTSCLYFDEEQSEWNDKGCRVGQKTSRSATQCFCNHLTSFASTFYVPMNRIVPAAEAFSQLDQNPVCFIFSICIVAVYFVIIVWARRADLNDVKKTGVTPLEDNRPEDQYGYEVTVWTGFRAGASTTAHVSFMLTGDIDEDRPRLLKDPKRKILQRGAIDTFYMTTPRMLGKLSHLRIWHDNHGNDPSWFFSRMLVEDVQNGHKFYFICDRYLAVEEDDGTIDRIVPIAGKDELTSFNHLFWSKTRRNLSDGHIWFSVFARPTRSKFTRVQRITCCLALIFGMMAANILFYDTGDSVESPQSVTLGPLTFSIHSIYVGLMSSLITFPASLIVVTIFRMSKAPPSMNRKKQLEKDIKKANAKAREKSITQLDVSKLDHEWGSALFDLDKEPIEDGRGKYLKSASPRNDGTQLITAGLSPGYSTQEQEAPKKKKKFRLPWWFIVFGYLLSFGTVAGAFMLIVMVGAGFGVKKSEEWLASMVVSLVETIFFTQPLKVLLLGLFYALVIKKPDQDEDEDNEQDLAFDSELLHKQLNGQTSHSHFDDAKPPVYMPPDQHLLEEARQLRFKELEMHSIIKDIVFYMLFLYLLLMCAYGNQDPWSYQLKEKMQQEFFHGMYSDYKQYGDAAMSIHKVHTRASFWDWMEGTMVPSMFTDTYYNGEPVKGGRFTADHNMFLMGVMRLRQMRVLPDSCEIPRPMRQITNSCRESYEIDSEDTGSYMMGWKPVNESNSEHIPDVGWNFTGAIELDGYPFNADISLYGGGGYVADLGNTRTEAAAVVRELKENNWLDMHTRAIFVEFVLYNPSLNLHVVSLTVVEFFAGGGALPYPRFHIMRLDRYVGTFMFVILGAEILTGLTILFFMVKEFKAIHKLKKAYFKDSWNVAEFILMLLSIATIVMFVFRLITAKLTLHHYQKDPTKFDNFQYTVTWDEMYSIMLALLVFGFTAKFLKLLRFNTKMNMLFRTLSKASTPLKGFMCIFLLMFIAFTQMAYLFFGRTLLGFKTFVASMETLGTMMLNRFDFNAFEEADSILGPTFFFLYSILITFILINMFMGILCEAFSSVKAELANEENKYEIVDFMVGRFKTLIGLGGPKKIKQDVHNYRDDSHTTDERCDEFQLKTAELLEKLTSYIAREQSKSQFTAPNSAVSRQSINTVLKSASKDSIL